MKNDNICVPTAPLKSIIAQYSELFARGADNEHIPQGWAELIQLACMDTKADSTLKVKTIKLAEGKLCAVFLGGSAEAQNAFQAILAEASAYCPFCGTLLEGNTRTCSASGQADADIPP